METFSALLASCAENSPVTGEFRAQRPVTRSFDVFCDLRVNKRLSKKSWGWWFETPSHSLWRHSNESNAILYSFHHHRLSTVIHRVYRLYESAKLINAMQRHPIKIALVQMNPAENNEIFSRYDWLHSTETNLVSMKSLLSICLHRRLHIWN